MHVTASRSDYCRAKACGRTFTTAHSAVFAFGQIVSVGAADTDEVAETVSHFMALSLLNSDGVALRHPDALPRSALVSAFFAPGAAILVAVSASRAR